MHRKALLFVQGILCLPLLLACSIGDRDPDTWVWAGVSNAKILMLSRAADSQGFGEIYILSKQGKISKVVDNTSLNRNPSISRDGRLIAFHRWTVPDDFASLELFMVDAVTGEETQLTSDSFANAIPKWKRDGTKLVYSSWRTYDTASEANIFVLDLSDWTVTQITSDPDHEDNDPAWCGDDAFVFKSTRETGEKYREQIFIMNLDGSGVRRLSSTVGWESDHDPRCSPDGEWIYFYRYEATRPWNEQNSWNWSEIYPVNVWRVNREGHQEKLTSCEHFCAGPIPAEDGRVLFVEKDFIISREAELIGSKARLMLMEADGSQPRELLPDFIYRQHAPTLEWVDW